MQHRQRRLSWGPKCVSWACVFCPYTTLLLSSFSTKKKNEKDRGSRESIDSTQAFVNVQRRCLGRIRHCSDYENAMAQFYSPGRHDVMNGNLGTSTTLLSIRSYMACSLPPERANFFSLLSDYAASTLSGKKILNVNFAPYLPLSFLHPPARSLSFHRSYFLSQRKPTVYR